MEALTEQVAGFSERDARQVAPFLEDLPREAEFLERYDRYRARIEAIVDMPDRTVDLLFRSLHQNDGRLSKRARDREFAQLTDEEVSAAEAAYLASFGERV